MAKTQTNLQGHWLPVKAEQLAALCGQEQTIAVKSHGWVSNAVRRGGLVFFTNQRGEKIKMRCNDQLWILE